jgi:biopolymer transport protein ExbD
MPRHPRSHSPERVDPNLTPLLDVVLQLITFFMMLVYFGTRIEGENRAVRLPEAPAALPTADMGLDRLAVVVDAQGRFIVGDGPGEDATGAAWWAAEAGKRRAGLKALGGDSRGELPTIVVIRADRDLPYGTVRRVLRTAQEQGFAHFTLVVLREPQR